MGPVGAVYQEHRGAGRSRTFTRKGAEGLFSDRVSLCALGCPGIASNSQSSTCLFPLIATVKGVGAISGLSWASVNVLLWGLKELDPRLRNEA